MLFFFCQVHILILNVIIIYIFFRRETAQEEAGDNSGRRKAKKGSVKNRRMGQKPKGGMGSRNKVAGRMTGRKRR